MAIPWAAAWSSPAPGLQEHPPHLVGQILALVKEDFKLGHVLVRPQGGLFLRSGLLLQLEPDLFQGLLCVFCLASARSFSYRALSSLACIMDTAT